VGQLVASGEAVRAFCKSLNGWRWFVLSSLLFVSLSAWAHVGSPDVYFDGYAGPYRLLVTVRPPRVIPGVAEVQIRSLSPDINELKIVPMRIIGPGADLAPVPDVAQRSSVDPQYFTGHLWIMLRGSWKVRIQVVGAQGNAELSVPVPAVAETALPMQHALAGLLLLLGAFLSVGLVTIVAVAARGGKLAVGDMPVPADRRNSLIAGIAATLVVTALLYFGNGWWASVARRNAITVYKLPKLEASLRPGGQLILHLQNPNGKNWSEAIKLDDLTPDHGHILHLFLVRQPGMDEFLHLHPEQKSAGVFVAELPTLPAGQYRIFADIVHHTGFPETQVGEIELPEITGKPLAADDSQAGFRAFGEGASSNLAVLPDGYRMIWEKDPAPLKADQVAWLRFRVEDATGKPATDLEPYMGMASHAAIIRSDSSVFVHLHPAGSVSMAAVALAGGHPSNAMAEMQMPQSSTTGVPIATSKISFPYGFPKPGDYRMFVQVRRAGHVDTGVFDMQVSP
jgi:hypothetical protein